MVTLSFSAQAAPQPTPIKVLHDGYCMNVSGAGTSNGTAIIQHPCTGNNVDNETWLLQPDGAYYWLVSQGSGKCLNVYGGSTADNVHAILFQCGNYANSQFSLVASGGGYQIVARHSGRCMGIAGASTSQVAQVVQLTCTATDAQRWTIPAAAITPLPGAGPAVGGTWSAPIGLSLVPVAAANLPNGKVLVWSAHDRYSFGGDVDYGKTYTALFDPATNTATERLVAETQHDMFCPGTANLADGRVLVNGGSSSAKTSLYNPFQNTWAASAQMNIPRGYQANTPLTDGKVFTLGGSWSGGLGGKNGERWDPATGVWTALPNAAIAPALTADAQGLYRSDNQLWLFTNDGPLVFHAGPSKQMNWYDTSGSGSVSAAGNRSDDADAMNGNAVLYDVRKILKVGGAPDYVNSVASAGAYRIDISNGIAVTKLAPMQYPRVLQNSVVLPDGKVVVIGGQTYSVPFSDAKSVLAPEIWNPVSLTFALGAPMAIPRNYHSVALLLPDGRVLAGGGGLCGGCNTNHADVEIYTPPYLYNPNGTLATRPVILSASTAIIGGNFSVQTNTPVTQFVLMRLASATHSVNNDQRRVPLTHVPLLNNEYQVNVPSNRGIVLPGYYMLFALNAAGVPSVSVTLQLI